MLSRVLKFDLFEDFSRYLLTITGLLLFLFLVLHLASISIIFVDVDFFEKYSDWLHSSHLVNFLELSLLAISIIHIFLTFKKLILNKKLGNNTRLISKRDDLFGSITAKLQPICGSIILTFLVVHLSQMRFPHPLSGEELFTITETLKKPTVCLIYVLTGISLSSHLYHGGESSFRSLGLLNKKNKTFIRFITRRIAFTLGFGFSIFALFLGNYFRLI